MNILHMNLIKLLSILDKGRNTIISPVSKHHADRYDEGDYAE